jgi:hypothetical protein
MTEGRLRIYQAASKILNILGKNSATSENSRLSRQEVFNLSGLDEELFHAACMHLRGLGHVMTPHSSQDMWLTAEGRKAYFPEWFERTQQASWGRLWGRLENLRANLTSFPLNNVINITGDVINAQFQQATTHSSQSGSFSSRSIEELSHLLKEIRDNLGNPAISSDDKTEGEAVVAQIEAQLCSPTPNKGFVVKSLRTLKRKFDRISEGAVSSAIGSGLAQKIAQVISSLIPS